MVRPHVTFGNSSTSAPPQLGGSNPRSYYVFPFGLSFLYNQYTRNNLYIYPEHRDHDPGHNGKNDGYGDLYPTNTPYLIISQGSSGSISRLCGCCRWFWRRFGPRSSKS